MNSKPYRPTVVLSQVMKSQSEYFLQVPQEWDGQDVMVEIDNRLEQFRVQGDRVTHPRLQALLDDALEVILIQHEV